jgi:carboxymethylenebutenolidase
MNERQQHVTGEPAAEHPDGIGRRAALQLGLLGAGTVAAHALSTSVAQAAPSAGAVVDWEPVPTQEIVFPGPRGPLMAAWAAAPERVLGGVLVMHENRGLTAHIRSIVSRFAASGFSALALDLLSQEGGTGAFPDEAAVAAALAGIAPERFDADMIAAVTELQTRLRRKGLGAVGFSFGGGMVWRLLAAGERRLNAAAPFYGPFPAGGDLSGARAKVLAVYGGLDTRVNVTIPAAKAALEDAELRHEILTFLSADQAFFNDTGVRFHVAAAAEAYRRVLGWFERFLG